MNFEFTNTLLSTITLESLISNVYFKESKLIEIILSSIEENKEITEDIIKIGCNYGEYITPRYIQMTTPVKKSNRGRKPKKKEEKKKYFNSQITFTIMDKYNSNKFYHIKLFCNGKVQITYVQTEDLEEMRYIIDKIISVINFYEDIKIDKSKNFEIIYIKSIMRNYKFNIDNEQIFIDLNKFQKIMNKFKLYLEDESIFKYEDINKDIYIKNYDLLHKFKLTLVKYSHERYVGFIIKFLTPCEDKPEKQTTIKIFSSNKFNIDSANNINEANCIKQILKIILSASSNYILYTKNV